jgi:hypothetical protein
VIKLCDCIIATTELKDGKVEAEVVAEKFVSSISFLE